MFLSMGGIQSVSSTDAHIGITFLRYTHHKYIYSCSVDTEACATVTAQGSRRNLRSGVDMYVRESFRRREHPSQNTPPPPPRLLTISPVWMLMAARIRNHFSVQARTLRSHDSAIHKNVSATAPSVFNPTGECQGIHRSGIPTLLAQGSPWCGLADHFIYPHHVHSPPA